MLVQRVVRWITLKLKCKDDDGQAPGEILPLHILAALNLSNVASRLFSIVVFVIIDLQTTFWLLVINLLQNTIFLASVFYLLSVLK